MITFLDVRKDIALEPDYAGTLHVHDQVWRRGFTLAPREVLVTRNDVASSDQSATIYHSVVECMSPLLFRAPYLFELGSAP